jgi:hypothetical protein
VSSLGSCPCFTCLWGQCRSRPNLMDSASNGVNPNFVSILKISFLPYNSHYSRSSSTFSPPYLPRSPLIIFRAHPSHSFTSFRPWSRWGLPRVRPQGGNTRRDLSSFHPTWLHIHLSAVIMHYPRVLSPLVRMYTGPPPRTPCAHRTCPSRHLPRRAVRCNCITVSTITTSVPWTHNSWSVYRLLSQRRSRTGTAANACHSRPMAT